MSGDISSETEWWKAGITFQPKSWKQEALAYFKVNTTKWYYSKSLDSTNNHKPRVPRDLITTKKSAMPLSMEKLYFFSFFDLSLASI